MYRGHFFGTDLLRQPNLFFFEELKMLMEKIDMTLQALLRREPKMRWIVLSAFSHIACRSTINLNSKLKQGGFLQYEELELAAPSAALQRKAAIEAIAGGREIAGFALKSMEGRLDLCNTVAASPVSGCVFLNRAGYFRDGIVDSGTYSDTYINVRDYLRETLSREFGSIVLNEIPQGANTSKGTPDFVVHAPGVEFHNTEDQVTRAYDHPRTTHSPKGFAILSDALDHSTRELKHTDIAKVMTMSG
jgi:hypothetical protein